MSPSSLPRGLTTETGGLREYAAICQVACTSARQMSPTSCACRTTTTWPTAHDDALIDDLARQGITFVST